MQQFFSIFIPQSAYSCQSNPHLKANKIPTLTRCQGFWILIICILFLFLFIHSFSQNQPQVYVKKCDVYECSSKVRALVSKSEAALVNSGQKQNDTQSQKNIGWQLQKIVWMYQPQTKTNQSQQKQLFTKLNYENTKYFANLSGYQIREFSLSTYSQYLSERSLTKFNQINTTIQNRKQSKSTSKQTLTQINQYEENVYKHLLTYLLLSQHGGVFIDQSVTIVERFETWLEQITLIPYINIGDKINFQQNKPKCFSFFDNDYSSLRLKANVMRQYEFERKLVAFPGLEEGFLACERGSEYLAKLIDVYVDILTEGKQSNRWQLMNKDQDMIGKTNPQRLYRDGHLIASHILLQERQAQLLGLNRAAENNKQQQPKSSHFTTRYTPLAIDSFSLITINNNLGPHKFRHIFLYQQKCYSYLTKLSLQQMSRTMGKVRFIAKLTPYVQWKLGRHLIQGSTKQVYFAKGSFLDEYFLRFLKNDHKELQKQYGLKTAPEIITFPINPQQNLQNPLWNTLPNTLWVIWDKGLQRHSKPIIQLCYSNLKKSAQASNFTIKVVSNHNIEQYISQQLRQKIHQTIKKADQPVSSQTISDFWRLAIMYQNGGVYVDASTFTTHQNYDFIRNITRIPSHMLWNRYGSQPQVFIFWNSLLGCPADWHYDFKLKTKVQWHLSYESNFIATIKHSEFVKEWLEVFMDWITLPYQEIYRQMTSVGMEGAKWTKTKDRYLLVMDVVKYVVGRREQLINSSSTAPRTYQSAADYYKIWSLSGQMIGQQKFRGQYNFESRDYRLDYMDQEILNLYKTQYSWQQAQQLLGSFDYQTKFFGLDLRESGFIWDNFYRDNTKNFTIDTFKQIIHPESVFGKLLLYRDPLLTEELMSYYNQMALTRLELKVAKMTGL